MLDDSVGNNYCVCLGKERCVCMCAACVCKREREGEKGERGSGSRCVVCGSWVAVRADLLCVAD